jgi:acyl carrier protein
VTTAPAQTAPSGRAELDAALDRCRAHQTPEEFFARLSRRGYEPGPALRAVRHLWRRDGESVALQHRSDVAGQAAWEAALLPLFAALPASLPAESAYRVTGLDRVRFHGDLAEEFWLHSTLSVQEAGERLRADATLVDQQGRTIAEFHGIRLHRLGMGRRTAGSCLRTVLALPQQAVSRISAAARLPRVPLPPLIPKRLLGELRDAVEPLGPPAVREEPTTAAHTPVTEGTDAVARRFVEIVAEQLGMDAQRVDVRRKLLDYGLDSVSAVQLRGRVRGELGCDLPLSRLLGRDTVKTLTNSLVRAS